MNINKKFDKYIKEMTEKINEDMVSGGGAMWGGDNGATGGNVGNTDSYAPGDSRIPCVIGSKSKKKIKRSGLIKNLKSKVTMLSRPRPNLLVQSYQQESKITKMKKQFPKEMKIGHNVEKEHKGVNPDKVASEHLAEFPKIKDGQNYYSKLIPMEKKLKKLNKKHE